jgi:hypothetical protein
MILEFRWPRPHTCTLDGDVIRQVGSGRDNQWEPLRHVPDLYLKFARLDGSAEACVDFAGRYGLLRVPAKIGAAEPIEDWQTEIRKMKGLANMTRDVRPVQSHRVLFRMTEVTVALLSGEPGSDVKPTLVLEPKHLLVAMKVQLASATAGGTVLHTCVQCGQWFGAGGEAKRSFAKFCSDPCRQRFHYHKVKSAGT